MWTLKRRNLELVNYTLYEMNHKCFYTKIGHLSFIHLMVESCQNIDAYNDCLFETMVTLVEIFLFWIWILGAWDPRRF